jgi:MFS family permease
MQLGMSGLFLPFTIYLQSVLGLTALQAGLVYVPFSVLSIALTPFVGQLTDRIGGKWILFTGLTLFSLGTLVQAVVAGVGTSRWAFVPGVLLGGAGVSCIFVPMITVAMGDISPRLAGAASGVLNTMRQLGGALGGALVGAILQNRLAASLHDEAVARASQVPAQARAGFVDGFSRAASSGLEVGAGQTGGQVRVPPGVPEEVAHRIADVARDVFDYAFVSAMRWSLAIPSLILLAAALACLWIKPPAHRQAQPAETEAVAA